MIKKGGIIDSICRKVGISERVKPGSNYFSKRELLQLNSWVEIAATWRQEKDTREGRCNQELPRSIQS